MVLSTGWSIVFEDLGCRATRLRIRKCVIVVVCVVGVAFGHKTGRAARAAVVSVLQTLQVKDGGVEPVAFFAQLSQYVLQIHGNLRAPLCPKHERVQKKAPIREVKPWS